MTDVQVSFLFYFPKMAESRAIDSNYIFFSLQNTKYSLWTKCKVICIQFKFIYFTFISEFYFIFLFYFLFFTSFTFFLSTSNLKKKHYERFFFCPLEGTIQSGHFNLKLFNKDGCLVQVSFYFLHKSGWFQSTGSFYTLFCF